MSYFLYRHFFSNVFISYFLYRYSFRIFGNVFISYFLHRYSCFAKQCLCCVSFFSSELFSIFDNAFMSYLLYQYSFSSLMHQLCEAMSPVFPVSLQNSDSSWVMHSLCILLFGALFLSLVTHSSFSLRIHSQFMLIFRFRIRLVGSIKLQVSFAKEPIKETIFSFYVDFSLQNSVPFLVMEWLRSEGSIKL